MTTGPRVTHDQAERTVIGVALVAVAVAVAALWIAPVTSSFWLDETGTIWAIRGTLAEALARASDVPGQQSAIYSFIEWWAVRLPVPLEVAARIPSLIAAAIAALGVYRFVRLSADALPAVVALAVFVTLKPIAFAAGDARAYALAVAAVTWGMVAWRRWSESGRSRDGIIAAALVAAAFHLQYTSAVLLPVYAWIAMTRKPVDGSRRASVVPPLVTFALLSVPTLAHAATLWQSRAVHSFALTPEATDLVAALAYPRLFAAIAVGALLASIAAPAWSWSRETMRGRWAIVALAWAAVPASLLFAVATLTSAKLFVARYFIWGTPGLAVLTGLWVASIPAPVARRVMALVIVGAVAMHAPRFGPAAHGNEDWRAAIAELAATDSTAPLLVQTGLIEARGGPATEPSDLSSPLLTPVAAYPGFHGAWILPTSVDSLTTWNLEVMATRLSASPRLMLLARGGNPSVEFWLRGRLGAAGYTARDLGPFAGVVAVVWERRARTP